MESSPFQFLPIAWPFFLALVAIFAIVVALIEIEVLRYAYERIGIN